MNSFMVGMGFWLASGLSAVGYYSDAPAKIPEEKKKAAAQAEGVTNEEFNDKGELISCLICGKAEISTVLGKTRGVQRARDMAEIRAKAAFQKYLQEKVSVENNASEDEVIIKKGSEESGKDSLKEEGTLVQKNSNKFKVMAEGLSRGLKVVYFDQNGEDKEYSVVLRYTKRSADAAEKTRVKLNTPPSEKVEVNNNKAESDGSEGKTKPRSESKVIPNKSGSVDD
jgi:hypothetical protein